MNDWANRMQPRKTLSQIVPYKPGRSIEEVRAEVGVDSIIKLASNENPFGSPVSPTELSECIASVGMYPDIVSSRLLAQLSQKIGVAPAQIILGNGSDEILTMLGLAYLNPGDRVLTAIETFSEYGFVTYLADAVLDTVPLIEFKFDLQAMAAAIRPETRLIFIANPNNPTGTIIRTPEFLEFMAQVPHSVGVVLDEAYAEFVDDPQYPNSVALLEQFPNLIVTRTFSKLYGLAGFRIGYAIAHPDIISTVYKVRQPFNINSVALGAASIALEKSEFVEKTLKNNRDERQRIRQFFETKGYRVIDSQANFLCIEIGASAVDCVRQLLMRGIIIRHLASFGMPHFVRITIGTPEQNDALIRAVTDIKTKDH